MWSVVYRGQIDIGMGLLEELWNKNLVNIFVSPLTVPEWITALLIFGFLVQSVILRATTRAQAFAWTFVWVLAPLSAIYFPLATSPPSVQVVARAMPTGYVFEEKRSTMRGAPPNWNSLGFATILTVIYVAISVWLMRRAFAKVLNAGLVKVY